MIGTRIGNWVLMSEVGRGHTGTVYRASAAEVKATDDPTIAAVKILHPATVRDSTFLERFPGEMLGLRRLTHPNIACFLDSGVHAGLAYYATEFVEGTDCATLLARHEKTAEQPGLNWQQSVLSIAVQATRALKHAHHRSILHRDLKPSNFILMADGTLKLTDFGVAKLVALPPLALPGEAMGTAGYLAPEHFTGKPLTRRSDLYALGGVIYTLLTGRPPFHATTAAEFMHKHCYTLPDRPGNFLPKLPAEIDELVCELMAKDPARRPASAPALLEEWDRIRGKLERKGEKVVFPPAPNDPTGTHAPLGDTPPAVSDREADPAERRAKRIKAAVLGGSLAVVIGLILFAFFRPRPSPESLWSDAQPLLASENPDDWDKARDEFLDPLTSRNPDWNADEVRAAKRRIKDTKEMLAAFAPLGKAKYGSEPERLYYLGLRQFQTGERAAARRTWEAVTRLFANTPEASPWVGLSKKATTQLDLLPALNLLPTPSHGTIVEDVRKLRASGQNAEADAMLKAFEELYRDRADTTIRVRAAREAGVPKP